MDDSVNENSKFFQLLIDRPSTRNNLILDKAYGTQVFILDDDPAKDRWIAFATGTGHNCVITTSNVLKCWGDNTYGQIGDETTVNKTTPVIIDSGVSYKSVSAESNQTCEITSSDTMKCWSNYNPLFGKSYLRPVGNY